MQQTHSKNNSTTCVNEYAKSVCILLDAVEMSWMPWILQKDVIFLDSDPPEAAGHSNWYMCSQKNVIVQDSDPAEAAGHSSA